MIHKRLVPGLLIAALAITFWLTSLTPAAAQQYYLRIGTETIGPLSIDETVQYPGFDPKTTLVAEVGATEWVIADNVPELVAAVRVQSGAATPTDAEANEPEEEAGWGDLLIVLLIVGGTLALVLVGIILIVRRAIAGSRSAANAAPEYTPDFGDSSTHLIPCRIVALLLVFEGIIPLLLDIFWVAFSADGSWEDFGRGAVMRVVVLIYLAAQLWANGLAMRKRIFTLIGIGLVLTVIGNFSMGVDLFEIVLVTFHFLAFYIIIIVLLTGYPSLWRYLVAGVLGIPYLLYYLLSVIGILLGG